MDSLSFSSSRPFDVCLPLDTFSLLNGSGTSGIHTASSKNSKREQQAQGTAISKNSKLKETMQRYDIVGPWKFRNGTHDKKVRSKTAIAWPRSITTENQNYSGPERHSPKSMSSILIEHKHCRSETSKSQVSQSRRNLSHAR